MKTNMKIKDESVNIQVKQYFGMYFYKLCVFRVVQRIDCLVFVIIIK